MLEGPTCSPCTVTIVPSSNSYWLKTAAWPQGVPAGVKVGVWERERDGGGRERVGWGEG
jgi:hypothetical protein